MTGMARRHTEIAALVSQEGVMAHAYTARTREGKVEVRRPALLASLSHFPGRGRQLGGGGGGPQIKEWQGLACCSYFNFDSTSN